MEKYVYYLVLASLLFSCGERKKEEIKEEENWIPLFNGKDLTGWDIKINGYPMNENYKNTFLVEDSLIKVNYQEYDSFRNEFGHLYYQKPFSHYRLRVEYRFRGKQVPGGPTWANTNSGVMLHAQSAAEQQLNQSFPAAIEFQLLGAVEGEDRTNGNMPSPGTHVTYGDSLYTPHMLYSNYPAPPADQWVSIEAIVYGDSLIHHLVEGDTVLTYRNPILGGFETHEDTMAPEDTTWFLKMKGTPLKKGYIALQAEGHAIEFRKVELLEMD